MPEPFILPPEARAADPPIADDPPLWPSPVPTFTYLAGAAGSGKTYATRQWAERAGGIVLCATTGIAAINLGGETVNAILGFFDTQSLREAFTQGFLTARLGKLWKSGVRRLVIDEVSMLDGDQLTYLVRAVEEVNGRGYVLDTRWDDEGVAPNMGLTLVGDFCQLMPVKGIYAFESPEWSRFDEAGHTKTLTEIRRQADPAFIEALRAARRGDPAGTVEYFRARLSATTDDAFDGPTLLARNEAVDRYNQLRMDRLYGDPIAFTSARWGKQRSEWGNPAKPPNTWGIPQTLQLRGGALVMVLANRRTEGDGPKELIYVNGDLGELLGADPATHSAIVRLQRTGKEVKVAYVHRDVRVPCDAARRAELRAAGQGDKIDGKWEIVGAIDYMPLRLAYASTVHKSQGLSLDRVQVNIRDKFFETPGMLYVALSRARTAEGLRLVGDADTLIKRCTTDPRLMPWL